MRRIGSLPLTTDRHQAKGFSAYLKQRGIDNTLEESPDELEVWVIDEDKLAQGEQELSQFLQNPNHPKYNVLPPLPEKENAPKPPRPKKGGLFSSAPYGKLTTLLIALAVILFFWSQFQRGVTMPPKIPGVIEAPVVGKLDQALLYDYPTYFTLREKLLTLYTPQDIEEGRPPSNEATALIQTLKTTPFWNGLYQRILLSFKHPSQKFSYKAPLFEKIREGQLYRLFTPALLHFNLLHIFFNLLWFIMLGNQVEFRLGFWRYLLFILLSALVSNTGQYLMSGSFFMGLSGVVCALAAFIWARQQVAPWEGYLLHRVTLLFLGVFVIGVFALQLLFFALQLFNVLNISLPIANTAHLTGALFGYLYGRLPQASAKKII